MSKSKGYAALDSKSELKPYSFERREPLEHDVVIDIKYCGICHSDIHQTRDEWSEYQDEAIFPDGSRARDRRSRFSRRQEGDEI